MHIENSSLTLHSALASMESGRYAAAVEDLSILISNRVHLDVAYLQRGLCLRALQQYEAAITDLEIALTQSHENKPDLYAGIADMWECLGDSARAIACYQTAIDASHHHAAAHFNLARLYIADAQYDGAARHFQYAFELDPLLLNAEMEFRLAQTLLKLGQFSKGWLGMEARWGMEAFLKTVTIPLGEPLKFDVSTLQDKSVLLWQDQGMGDTLQFCRYAPLIADLGARVFLNAPSALVPLLRNLDQRVQVLHQGMPLRRTDYQCSVSSLPLILKTDSVSKIPAQVPYLFSHPLKRNEWLVRLDQGASSVQKFRVGLAWAGGDRPNLIEQVEMNERRNLPIEKLTQLAHQQIDFISLQKGEVAEFELKSLMQQDSSEFSCADYSDHIHDFSDTAALIDNLDLVITVDTAVAHLAGAMNKPVWILNRFDACWRWLYGQDAIRTDSPWYPSARLFRQPKRGDWDSVIQQVRVALIEELNKY